MKKFIYYFLLALALACLTVMANAQTALEDSMERLSAGSNSNSNEEEVGEASCVLQGCSPQQISDAWKARFDSAECDPDALNDIPLISH